MELAGCPRHATSLMLCSCHVVPGKMGKFLVLDKDQYKIWKQNHKKKERK